MTLARGTRSDACTRGVPVCGGAHRDAGPSLACAAWAWPRRALCALLLLALPAAGALAQRTPTTQTSIGIFYQPGAPETASLWRDGDEGQRLALSGRVLDRQGEVVSGALVETWHADARGGVDESRYRAVQRSDERGRFALRTVLPGHIPMARGNVIFAPRHIHIVVTHPAHPRLVSMIFFKGDDRLGFSPYRELAIPLETSRGPQGEVLLGEVEIVLGAPPLPPGSLDPGD